jgi:hypothetical protein
MINIVRTIDTTVDSIGRRIVKFFRLGKTVETAMQAAAYGTDAQPIEDCIAIYAQTGVKGKTVIIGYINKNAVAGVGEHRLFSTDADGAVQFYIHLKNDGTCEIGGSANHMTRYEELETAFNELKSDFNTHVNNYNTHVHPGVLAGPASTAVTVSVSTPSQADISGAKIDEIKTL